MPHRVSGEILQLIERRRQLSIARITGVTQGAINKILKGAWQTRSPNQRPFGHRQNIFTSQEDQQLLRIMHANWLLSSLKLRTQPIRRTGYRLSVRTITQHFLATGYSCRQARCPRLTSVNCCSCCQWARRHCVWDIHHWRHCSYSDESRFELHDTGGRALLHRWQSERQIDVCVQRTYGNAGPSAIVWAGFHYGGQSELLMLGGTVNMTN